MCRAHLNVCAALSNVYTALLSVYRDLLSVRRALFRGCTAVYTPFEALIQRIPALLLTSECIKGSFDLKWVSFECV